MWFHTTTKHIMRTRSGKTYIVLSKCQQVINEKELALAEVHFKCANLLSEVHFKCANLLSDEEDIVGAMHHYQEALRINPEHAYLHINYALLLKNKMNDVQGAKHHYEEALRIDPEYANAHYNYANFLKNKMNDVKGAKYHYEEALRIDPEYADAHFYYAYLLNKMNDVKGAKYHYEEALRINPEDASAKRKLLKLRKAAMLVAADAAMSELTTDIAEKGYSALGSLMCDLQQRASTLAWKRECITAHADGGSSSSAT